MQLCGRIFKKNPPTPFCPHPAPKSLYKGEPLWFKRISIPSWQKEPIEKGETFGHQLGSSVDQFDDF